MIEWPPTLPTLKNDVAIPEDDTEDDDALQRRLDASVRFVQRVRKDLFETDDEGAIVDPPVFTEKGEREEGDSILMGTLMLAHTLFARRRSPDMILWMSETGTTRVPGNDPHINRMLGLHRARVG